MQKNNTGRASLGIILAWMTTSGCSSSDERLAEFAEQSVASQRQQNEALSRQSEAVVKESHELAFAAKELVTQDAQARQDLIQAQSQWHEQLHQERTSVDRQREQLDGERRDIAQARQRDPIIGSAIQAFGILLGCLAPLVLAAYALRQVSRANHEPAELGELLLGEITSPQPLLLPRLDKPLLPRPREHADHVTQEPTYGQSPP